LDSSDHASSDSEGASATAALPAPPVTAPPPPVPVTVNFVSPDGLTQHDKVNRPRRMEMNGVFDAYAQRTSMDLAGLRFVHAGRFVRYCQTLEELGLHDGNQVHVHALCFRAESYELSLKKPQKLNRSFFLPRFAQPSH
jgi:hypothetical protein